MHHQRYIIIIMRLLLLCMSEMRSENSLSCHPVELGIQTTWTEVTLKRTVRRPAQSRNTLNGRNF